MQTLCIMHVNLINVKKELLFITLKKTKKSSSYFLYLLQLNSKLNFK